MDSKSPKRVYGLARAPKAPWLVPADQIKEVWRSGSVRSGLEPLKPEDIPEGDWIEWVRPSLWERLCYLFNAPRRLVVHLDGPWHPLD